MKRVITAAAISLAAVQGIASTLNVPGGYLTGNTFRNYTDPMQTAYVAGLIDGFFEAPQFASMNLKPTANLDDCTNGMNVGQVKAIVNKYMSDNPAIWAQSMNFIALKAMMSACAQIGKSLDR